MRAILEDYRAGLRMDRAHDEVDQTSGRRVSCPTLVLWSRHDDLEDLYGDPLQIWERWTDDLRGGHSINSAQHGVEIVNAAAGEADQRGVVALAVSAFAVVVGAAGRVGETGEC